MALTFAEQFGLVLRNNDVLTAGPKLEAILAAKRAAQWKTGTT